MFDRLRWLTVVLPALAVGAIEWLSDTALDEILPFPGDTIVVVLIVGALAFAFSSLTFRRIDALAGQLEDRNAELQRRNASIRALHGVSLAITAISELDRIMQAVVDQARGLVGADGALLLLDSGAGDPAIRVLSGDPSAVAVEGTVAGGSRLEVPLQRGGETIGSLVIGSREKQHYGAEDVETVSSLANQAAIAVENARLQGRLRELAVAEERERIAREMHDGLAQVLGYVNTKSMAVDHLLDDERVTEARLQLQQLAAAARSIYVDVREAILGLRSAIDPATGLVPAIQSYTERFAEASKLVVDVEAAEGVRAISLPDAAQGHIFRIVQESLTNVRKHAAAHRVRVSMEVADGTLVVRIADDGSGMAGSVDASTDWPHYGLAAMRERAAASHGTIEWIAGPAGGTIVEFRVPVLAEEVDPGPAMIGVPG